ncbi:phage minor head protein [Tomitella gaofuii]|uniref:phage minor head protein n=1 Tax=Tomitella gaofuii TaxID=2760083 RepID=UPI002E2D27D7|nr:phage minor head protein [Tomitella gaofuii]
MYPPSTRAMLVAQLEAEAAMLGLTLEAYVRWLPTVRQQVLGRTVDTSTAAMAATELEWDTILDGLILYGGGLVYGHRVTQAAQAMGVVLETVGDVIEPAATPLARTARRIVADALGTTPDTVAALDRQLSNVPTVKTLRSEYLSGVRNRMADTPEAVFRDITTTLDKGMAAGRDMDTMAMEVKAFLNTDTGDWPSRAMTVARTEAAGAQTSATLDAARLQAAVLEEEGLQKCWVATLDRATRSTHWAADGQRVDVDGKFTVGGHLMEGPGDPDAPASETANCRCGVFLLAPDEPLPDEMDRHTERGPGDSTVKNRDGSQADEIERRADEGNIRARDDPDGIGQVAASIEGATMAEDDDQKPDPAGDYRTFTDATVALLGTATDDGRMLAADIDLTFRSFPLPLMWVKQTSFGHDNAYTVGVIEAARVDGERVLASGYMLNTAEADEAAEQIGHGVTGPSVDLGAVDWVTADENGDPLTGEQVDEIYDEAMDGGEAPAVVMLITAATLMGVTLVSTPAFGDTTITLDGTGDRDESVAASILAAGYIEPVRDSALFADPGFDGPTPLRIEDGRIMGHLACFDSCHVGLSECVTAPHSQTGYAHFHTAPPVLVEDGNRLPVGRLTVGTGHAGSRAPAHAAAAHYDDTGTCFALVRAGEDEHGIWVSGVPAPGVTDETLAQGLAAPLSGDWRSIGGNLELVAALAVNTPGFPVVASGATDLDDKPLALVASLAPTEEPETKLSASQVADEVMARLDARERRTVANNIVVNVTNMERAREAAALIHRIGGQ